MSVGEEELSVRLLLVCWTMIITRYPSMIPFCWSSSSGSQVICIVLESTAITATLPGSPLGTVYKIIYVIVRDRSRKMWIGDV